MHLRSVSPHAIQALCLDGCIGRPESQDPREVSENRLQAGGLQQTTLPSSPECWMKELSAGEHRSKMSAAILRRAPNMSAVATICTTWRTSSGRLPAHVQTVPSDFRTARVASLPDSPGYSSSQRPRPITFLLHWSPCRRPSKPQAVLQTRNCRALHKNVI